jgi:hypothetical protein
MLTPESVQPEESRAAVAVVRPEPSQDLPGLVARFRELPVFWLENEAECERLSGEEGSPWK